jgi:hypothetical protein
VRAALTAHGSSISHGDTTLRSQCGIGFHSLAMDLLMAVQVDEVQVAFLVRPTLVPWPPMMDMQFFAIEERHATVGTDVLLSLGQLPLSGRNVSGFRLFSPLPVVSQ